MFFEGIKPFSTLVASICDLSSRWLFEFILYIDAQRMGFTNPSIDMFAKTNPILQTKEHEHIILSI